MGQGLPKAVTSIVLEKDGGELFDVGLAEMNGWRPSMEDAHVMVMRDSWGFFGIFDGHGGQHCSAFVARRLTEELKKQELPESDTAVKALMLRIDKEFLDSQQPSGSTGTFAFVVPAVGDQKQVQLRVGNIGDSRVLLGRSDGTMVEGPGTDGGLTTDHKPDNEVERERIYRTGGKVETIMGVARVNGDLAVSRAFGDAHLKQTGGPAQEDHPVSVEPEFTILSCSPTDFLVLVCDGISEGNFPNREVVQLAARELKVNPPAEAAAAVCRMALDRGSMDNLSCMIVQFRRGDEGHEKTLLPGPFSAPTNGVFRQAWAAMAERAGTSLEAAIEKRHDEARKERLKAVMRGANGAEGETTATEDVTAPLVSGELLEDLRAELAAFDSGPPASLPLESPERTQWFKEWLESVEVEPAFDPQNMTRDQLLDALERNPRWLEIARAEGVVSQKLLRTVRVTGLERLRETMEAHPSLKWDARLEALCEQTGRVLVDDSSDSTAKVRFRGTVSATVWLPASCLLEEGGLDAQDSPREDDPPRKVRVRSQLKEAVDAHETLLWQEEFSRLPGQVGEILEEESSDGIVLVRFPPPLCLTAWLPESSVEDDDKQEADEADGDSKVSLGTAEGMAKKRQRTAGWPP